MIALGIALTAVVGWLVLPRRLDLDLVAGLSLGFLTASFGLSVEFFFFALVGLPFNAWLAIGPWIGAVAYMTWRSRPSLKVEFNTGAAAAAVAAGVVLFVWFPFERALPLTSQSWDAWAIWLFKAKAFYLDGDINGYLSRTSEFGGQPGYPLLTPLYSLWLYKWAGVIADQGAKLTSPCYFVATLGVAWGFLRKLTSPIFAGVGVALIALIPMAQETAFVWAGYADTALAAYMLTASGFLYLWLEERRAFDLAAASLAATAAAWTKNEGMVVLAVFIALALFVAAKRGAPAGRAAVVLVPPALLLGAWFAVRTFYGIEAAGFTPGLSFSPKLFATALSSMAAKAFSPRRFDLVFPLFVAAAIFAAVRRPWGFRWVPAAFVIAHLAGALLAYSTGRNEIQWWLETSADRILAQIAPLAVLASAVAFAPWLREDDASA